MKKKPQLLFISILLIVLGRQTATCFTISKVASRRNPSRLAATAAPSVESIVTAGLLDKEINVLEKTIQKLLDPKVPLPKATILPQPIVVPTVPGAMGRVVQIGVQHSREDWRTNFQIELMDQWNEYLYTGSMQSKGVYQPFLLAVEEVEAASDDEKKVDDPQTLKDNLSALIAEQVAQFDLRKTFPKTQDALDNLSKEPLTPTLQYEVDVGEATDTTNFQQPITFVDTSSALVLDGLISDDLRRRLFNVVHSYQDDDEDVWDDRQGPDPRRWVRGGLVDNLDDDKEQSSSNFGLTAEATEDLCYNSHAALQEVESLLASLFPHVAISRLEGSVFGEPHVTPLTANAPCAGDQYQPHIDADPMAFPPSIWTDVYGRYPNRAPGKPRFLSCLVYLNEHWGYEKWGGPTRIWDRPSGQTIDIAPLPGRILLMDQDVVHSVVAPTAKQPRYSLVWKLILHPTTEGQDMKEAIRQPTWPEPTFVGRPIATMD